MLQAVLYIGVGGVSYMWTWSPRPQWQRAHQQRHSTLIAGGGGRSHDLFVLHVLCVAARCLTTL
jgi:hypothetical protein